MSWLGSLLDLARDVFDYVTKGRKVELPPEPKPLPPGTVRTIEEARKRRASK